jgi:RNA polymerase sigma-70 factor (ECF subfamily)
MKPTQELIDQILILRCQVRDRQAFAELIDRYQRPLRYFVTRLIGNQDLAEEFCQETWLTVLGKIHTLRNAGTFSTWLYRIARNKVYQALRKKKQFVELDEEIEAPDGTEDKIEFFEDVAKLHRCLDRLKPIHKEVLMLKFLEDMSYEQIADVLDCHVGTVRSRIFHAKLALKRELEESP